MTDWERLAKGLAASVAAHLDPQWQDAFAHTPRHHFVPRFWALDQYNNPANLVDGADPEQRERWLAACYSDQVLITQWHGKDGRRIVTSSASMPSIVAEMLRNLELRGDARVLEIGTGYNTALLCHRLGDSSVATVDIDPVLVTEAQCRLARVGYHPVVETGDGAEGIAAAAPYDRILSTCSAASVPTAWINQLADGGLIVAPLTFGGALAVLRKTSPSEVSGHLAPEQAYFMPLHAAGESMPDSYIVDLPGLDEFPASHDATTDVPMESWANPDWLLWLALHLPHGHVADLVNEQMDRTGVVVYTADHRAQVNYSAGEAGKWPVTRDQGGLWDSVSTAWRAWQQHDQPDRTRIGITARGSGEQWVWLDTPDQPIP